MRIYLAGTGGHYDVLKKTGIYNYCRLDSFFYIKEKDMQEVHKYDSYMLDSGAYSTFRDPKSAKGIDWDTYVKNYINCIRKYDIKLFFELDIDEIVGLSKVEYYRNQMADATGIMPIVVWHSSRGWSYFEKMCEEYNYVALGTTLANNQGVVIRKNPMLLNKFIHTAHKNRAKIHGLGFTSLKYMRHLRFDSVDSTSWLYSRYGMLWTFNGRDLILEKKRPGTRVKPADAVEYNFRQWILYSKYAEAYL